jgi:hypothetical protein
VRADTDTRFVARNLLGSSGLYATSCESAVVIETELALVVRPMRTSGSSARKNDSLAASCAENERVMRRMKDGTRGFITNIITEESATVFYCNERRRHISCPVFSCGFV